MLRGSKNILLEIKRLKLNLLIKTTFKFDYEDQVMFCLNVLISKLPNSTQPNSNLCTL